MTSGNGRPVDVTEGAMHDVMLRAGHAWPEGPVDYGLDAAPTPAPNVTLVANGNGPKVNTRAKGKLKTKAKPVEEKAPPRVVAPEDDPATADLLKDTIGFIRRFMVLPTDASYRTAALFVLTRGRSAPPRNPVLRGREPGEGIRQNPAARGARAAVPGRRKAASVSVAGALPDRRAKQPTLLIDEADAIFGRQRRTQRGAARRAQCGQPARHDRHPRQQGGRGDRVRRLLPEGDRGIATGRLPDTIRDRAIVIAIDRKKKSERVERLRARRRAPSSSTLRAGMVAGVRRSTTRALSVQLDEAQAISDRLEEAWEPLLAIAALAGGPGPRARRAAEGLAPAMLGTTATTPISALLAMPRPVRRQRARGDEGDRRGLERATRSCRSAATGTARAQGQSLGQPAQALPDQAQAR